MAELRFAGASVRLDGEDVLADLDLTLPDGGFVAIVGPSGVGKSTLLRVVAGLVPLASGVLEFDGVDVTTVAAARRDIGMVFEKPALLPKRNVRRNVEFPLEMRHETVEAIRQRVDAEVRALHIEHLLLRSPSELSRGEQQLVQIARAMVRTPRVLLLDEPFSPLDPPLRSRMREELRLLQAGYGVTTLIATNDPEDLDAVATHVVVLGRPDGATTGPAVPLQHGTPSEVHREPATLGVAQATGPMWTIEAGVSADADGFWLRGQAGDDRLTLRAWSPAIAPYVGGRVLVGVRSADLRATGAGALRATFVRNVPGAEPSLLCRWGGAALLAPGSPTDAEPGAPVTLDVSRFCVFDPATGARVA